MTTPTHYRPRPRTVTAMQFDGTQKSAHAAERWVKSLGGDASVHVLDACVTLYVRVPVYGLTAVTKGMFVVFSGVQGWFEARTPEMFEAWYLVEGAHAKTG